MLKQIVLDWSKVKARGEGFSDYMFLICDLLFIYYIIKMLHFSLRIHTNRFKYFQSLFSVHCSMVYVVILLP